MSKSCDSTAGASKHGYNRFLLLVAGLGGLLYGVDVGIIAGAFFLPETKGKTLEEIEEHFEGRRNKIVPRTFYPQEST